jgi:hypothetical protein
MPDFISAIAKTLTATPAESLSISSTSTSPSVFLLSSTSFSSSTNSPTPAQMSQNANIRAPMQEQVRKCKRLTFGASVHGHAAACQLQLPHHHVGYALAAINFKTATALHSLNTNVTAQGRGLKTKA